MMLLSDAEVESLLDKVEARIRRVFSDLLEEYGFTKPQDVDAFLASLPRKTEEQSRNEKRPAGPVSPSDTINH